VAKALNVEEYLAQCPPLGLMRIQEFRKWMREHFPEAVESLSYGIIAYHWNRKALVYCGAFAKHLGIYALPGTHEQFADHLREYKHGKGSVQFPHSKEIPWEILHGMVLSRQSEIEGERP
jgi:uncharacterized protein YdhG (YjbR/CyaY superfamily)